MKQFLSPTLHRVIKGDLCSGCGACAAIGAGKVSMIVAPPGFNRPEQTRPLEPELESAIDAICPGSNMAQWEDGTKTHPLWGPIETVATGAATDSQLRHQASSGGMISALLIAALDEGLIDAVLHVRTDPSDPTRNIMTRSTSAEQIKQGAGSRYAPSSPLAGLQTLLDETTRFAFVGKPCDVSALRQWGAIDARIADRFPIIVSFFCGGIPSHKGTEAILDDLGVKKSDLSDFRYRGDGWPGYATAIRHDGSRERMSYMESWGSRLSKHVQFRCKICPDAVGGVADIVAADAWHGDERGYPLFDEAEGRSLVISRTSIGSALIDRARSTGRISIQDCPVEDISKMQPSQARRKRLARSRLWAMAACLQPRPNADGVFVREAALGAGRVESVKSFLGLIRRIVTGKR